MKGETEMNFTELWMNIFGTVTGWFGINIGFWVGMGICAAIVVVMNLICWLMPPRKDRETD